MAKLKSLFEKYPSFPQPDELAELEDRFIESKYVEDERIPEVVARSLTSDNEILAKIGQISIEWAALERRVDESIWAIMGNDSKKGACLTSQFIGPGPRARALVSLCEVSGFDNNLAEDILLFKTDAEKLGAKRNRILHDQWSELVNRKTKEKSIIRHEIAPEAAHNAEIKQISCEDVSDILNNIIRLNYIFSQFVYLRIVSAVHQAARSSTDERGSTAGVDTRP